MSSSSNAEASTSAGGDVTPRAGPLPTKAGEIGYDPEMREVDLADGLAPAATARSSQSPTPTAASTTTAASSSSILSKRSIISTFFSRKTIGGVTNSVITRIVVMLALLAGTSTGWAVSILHYQGQVASATNNPIVDGSSQSAQSAMQMSSLIFIHVAFAVATLLELVFFERAVFQARAERYNHIHGGSSSSTAATNMGFAPWNRPPLPTYAAAIAGRGTGDAEDAIIVQPPPPAYGNTRGSVLLLAGFLRDSMRSHRTVRQSGASTNNNSPPMTQTLRPPRPISYGESEEVSDAARARAVEEALARLEEGGASGRRNA